MKKKLKRPIPVYNVEDDERAYRLFLSRYTKTQIAGILGITKQAVSRWMTVPLKYVRQLSEATGISKRKLRPSDFAASKRPPLQWRSRDRGRQ
jgi:hypothetical protein